MRLTTLNGISADRSCLMRSLVCAAVFALSPSQLFAAPTTIPLPDKTAFPESVTATSDGSLYVGSIVSGGITRLDQQGKTEVWAKPGAFGSASILGVLADERTNTLWACSNNYSSYGVSVPGAREGSALLGFDLKSQEGRIRAVLPSDPSSCNDIVIGSDGAVYITNSETPEILRLAPGSSKLEIWFTEPSLRPAPAGAGIDGIEFGGDGNLYVSHFDSGALYRVSIRDGKSAGLTKLRPSHDLVQPDAIRRLHDNVFLLVEGGGRLHRMTIDGDTASLTTLKDGFDTPTSVAVSGSTAWVTEGQLQHLLEPQKARLPFKLFAVPLNR